MKFFNLDTYVIMLCCFGSIGDAVVVLQGKLVALVQEMLVALVGRVGKPLSSCNHLLMFYFSCPAVQSEN